MAAADAHPVWMCRAATIVSMQQLEDDYVADGKAAAAAQPLQCVARPEAPVAEAVGACLARYSFPALECKIHPPQKRVRSFGDLNNALVPNIEEGSDGWCAPLHECAQLLTCHAVRRIAASLRAPAGAADACCAQEMCCTDTRSCVCRAGWSP
jgi:hypothetical protein